MERELFLKEIKKLFVTNSLKIEILNTLLPVPVLSILVGMYFDTGSTEFYGTSVTISMIVTLLLLHGYKYYTYRWVIKKVQSDNKQDLKEMLIRVSRFPFHDMVIMILRWLVLTTIIVLLPNYLQHKNSHDFISAMIIVLFTSFISGWISYLISENHMIHIINSEYLMDFYDEKKKISGVNLNIKILLSTTLVALYAVAMFMALIYYASTENSAINNYFGGFAAIIIVSIGMAIALTVYLNKGIKIVVGTVQMVASQVANDDYRVRVDYYSKGELGEIMSGIGSVVNSSKNTISRVKDSSSELTALAEQLSINSSETSRASEEIGGAVAGIADGASNQATDTVKGVERMNGFNQLLEKNHELLKALNEIVKEVDQLKSAGLEAVVTLKQTTDESNIANHEISLIIQETDTNVSKIQSASDMIKSIADQTNLLALNASIEAARAGEAGKGFAVVAEEIRKLAEQSNQFTSEIAVIIGELTNGTAKALDALKEITRTSNEQNQSVNITDDKFNGIATAINQIEAAITDINMSEERMDAEQQEISLIFDSLSAISEENSASTEEIAASVEEQTASVEEVAQASKHLNEMAKELTDYVAVFKIDS